MKTNPSETEQKVFHCKCGNPIGLHDEIMTWLQANPAYNGRRCHTCKSVVTWRSGALYWLNRKERRQLEARNALVPASAASTIPAPPEES